MSTFILRSNTDPQLDNVDHWQVFEDDEQINRFLQMSGEFENLKIDQENMNDKKESAELEPTHLT